MPTEGKPQFVVLEGVDGAGTTTQAGLLAEALRAGDLRVCVTAEPSDGPIGRLLRAHVRGEVTLDPLAAALAFCADRADHLERVVRPALHRGEWVVCDRYLLSTLAYQGAEGVDRGLILEASAAADVPDLTVFLDVPGAEAARRRTSRGAADRYDSLGARLEESYRTSIALLRARGHPIEVVGGTGDPGEVSRAVRARLDFQV